MKQTNMMNFFKASLVVLALVTGPFASAATSAAEYKKQVGDVIFSLETIKDGSLIAEIQRLDRMAGGVVVRTQANGAGSTLSGQYGGAITVKVAAEIAEKTMTAWELLDVIIKDESLKPEDRKELVLSLGSELGTLFSTTIRHQGDDELDPELNKSPRIVKFLKTAGLEWVRTFTDLFTFHRATDERALQIAAEGNGAINENIKAIPNQGARIWKIKERMYREWLAQTVIIDAQETMRDLGEFSPESKDYRAMKFDLAIPKDKQENSADLGAAQKALLVRQNRVAGHYAVLGSIGLGAMIWTITPVDYVGMAVGYDLVTARISDFITYGGLTALALIRNSTGSFSTIPELKRLLEIIDKPVTRDAQGNVVTRAEISNLKLPFMARLLRIRSKAEAARAKIKATGTDVPVRAEVPAASAKASGGGGIFACFNIFSKKK